MYHLFAKETGKFDSRKHIKDFEDVEDAYDYVDKKLAQDADFKYVIEETTGFVDGYGELIRKVVEEN
ncbi:MAG: hypothetical protein E7Z91_03980 [Cyanobacteria bacterium SIG30]|nr:hypothetical protein [Cyanobacteria bacterium SIG30]